MTALRNKINEVIRSMNSELYEREDDIHALVLAILSKNHIFFYGEPGVAKSKMIDLFTDLIIDSKPGDLFKVLVTEGTSPEELVGPPSLSAMRQDIWKRNTERMMPRARFVFADELWNANSMALNLMNPILNERQFYNHDEDPNIPLWTMMCASNSLPRSNTLAAVADRIAIWRVVESIQEDKNFESMIFADNDPIQPCITFAEIAEAQAEILKVELPIEIAEQIVEIRAKVRDARITVSDRRYKQAINILRAEAWLDGSDVITTDHLRPLADILWRQLDQIDTVRDIIYNLIDPVRQDAEDLWEQLRLAYSEFGVLSQQTDDIDALGLCARNIIDKFVAAKPEVDELRLRCKDGESKTINEMVEWMKTTGSFLLAKGLNINDEQADFFKLG